jgi:hypothetical protein
MDRISKKSLRSDILPTTPVPGSAPGPQGKPNNVQGISGLSKWVPLICAGSAIGIGLFALKEIKNTRRELSVLRKESFSATPADNSKLEKKMELLEEQLKTITIFLKNKQDIPPPVQRPLPKKKKEIIEPVDVEPENIVIINAEQDYNPDEYEEVEVTDSEGED